MSLPVRIFLAIITSLVYYLMMEYLNDGNYFDFSDKKTYGKIILSLFFGVISEAVVKYNKKSS